MNKYLLDTNLLVYLFDDDRANKENKEKAKKILAEKLQEEGSQIFVTELIRYEILRGIEWDKLDNLQKVKKGLKDFPTLQINQKVADMARNLYRFDQATYTRGGSSKNFDKYRFDAFHVATAKVYGLQLLSFDTDIEKINRLCQKMEEDYKPLPS
ncbi:PIN domain-containing protein [uncultured Cardiobacterium sp.]|uniref:PIN domain-containing protein n=1 Tax=uncultured Cardiobacterium sp. TaxID=417619 RepID=UPI00261E602D|nr:PIN domain-containing protein [uncultured Cardiobacterium sp.]